MREAYLTSKAEPAVHVTKLEKNDDLGIKRKAFKPGRTIKENCTRRTAPIGEYDFDTGGMTQLPSHPPTIIINDIKKEKLLRNQKCRKMESGMFIISKDIIAKQGLNREIDGCTITGQPNSGQPAPPIRPHVPKGLQYSGNNCATNRKCNLSAQTSIATVHTQDDLSDDVRSVKGTITRSPSKEEVKAGITMNCAPHGPEVRGLIGIKFSRSKAKNPFSIDSPAFEGRNRKPTKEGNNVLEPDETSILTFNTKESVTEILNNKIIRALVQNDEEKKRASTAGGVAKATIPMKTMLPSIKLASGEDITSDGKPPRPPPKKDKMLLRQKTHHLTCIPPEGDPIGTDEFNVKDIGKSTMLCTPAYAQSSDTFNTGSTVDESGEGTRESSKTSTFFAVEEAHEGNPADLDDANYAFFSDEEPFSPSFHYSKYRYNDKEHNAQFGRPDRMSGKSGCLDRHQYPTKKQDQAQENKENIDNCIELPYSYFFNQTENDEEEYPETIRIATHTLTSWDCISSKNKLNDVPLMKTPIPKEFIQIGEILQKEHNVTPEEIVYSATSVGIARNEKTENEEAPDSRYRLECPKILWIRGGRVYDYFGDLGLVEEFIKEDTPWQTLRSKRRDLGYLPFPFLPIPISERNDDGMVMKYKDELNRWLRKVPLNS